MNISQDEIATILRTILKAGGGWLIGHGVISADSWVSASAGIAAVGASLIWGIISARKDAAVKANANNRA